MDQLLIMAQLVLFFNAGECNAHCKDFGYMKGMLLKDQKTCFCGDYYSLKELQDQLIMPQVVRSSPVIFMNSSE